jgi:hypothetical protein
MREKRKRVKDNFNQLVKELNKVKNLDTCVLLLKILILVWLRGRH